MSGDKEKGIRIGIGGAVTLEQEYLEAQPHSAGRGSAESASHPQTGRMSSRNPSILLGLPAQARIRLGPSVGQNMHKLFKISS